jgi:TetR/AcrR family transcriptional regulator
MVDRDRRSDILSAAEAEFGTAGFAGGRIERIAAAARVNKQLLFHYFGSKEGLLRAALEALFVRLDPPAASGSPVDDLRQVLRFLERSARETPGLTALLADGYFNPQYPKEAQQLVRGWLSRLYERVQGVLADGQRRGYFRDDIEPRGVAQMAVSSAIWGIAVDGIVIDSCTWR